MTSDQRPDTSAAAGIARAVDDAGIEHVFLMTGGDIPLWQALDRRGIRHVLARSEASAVYMADGYSRVSARPSVVYGQWGPGAANVAAALADAWWARSPVVALTSSMGLRDRYTAEYQELEQLGMFEAVTKWNGEIPTPARAASLTAEAVRTATRFPLGPVHLDFPRDVLTADASGGVERGPGVDVTAIRQPSPSREDVDHVVDLLSAAERPVLLAGGGVVAGDAWVELADLAVTASLPVVTSMAGKSSMTDDHPCSVGVVGRYSRAVSNQVLTEADLLVVVGSDLGGLVTDGGTLIPDGCAVVQVDLDAGVLARRPEVRYAVHAGAAPFLAALRSSLAEPSPAHVSWHEQVQGRVGAWKDGLAAVVSEATPSAVSPEAVLAAVGEFLGPDDVLVADTGYMGAWAGALAPVRTAGRTFLRAAGSLGWAFPAALGAQLALAPTGRAVCVIGDGGFGYHVGDVETAVRLGLPVVTIVLNNSCLAYELHLQERVFGGHVVSEVNDFAETDYAAVARAFGAAGERVTTPAELQSALEKARHHDAPTVIDAVVPVDRPAPVTTYAAVGERIL